uniref:Cytochrome c oxidase subunit 2 n=1 Tax=Spinibdella lignicola TaxID=2872682 RepID=A0A977S5G7_9ACAR|nr:cytochrome c oxidase subunit II [Spinibdella lignicola]UXN44115.1 cytochrome c oxidase subunit II [Spinibdella lignicola]
MMEHLIMFHDHSMIIILFISCLMLMSIILNFYKKPFTKFIMESQNMELLWTMTPSIMLMFIASPSMKLLYMTEDSFSPSISIKSTGFQWYWSYESNMFNETESFLENSNFMRLLDTNYNIMIPSMMPIRLIATSADVIHSWTIPSLGIKADAMPGRLNQMNLIINHPTMLIGQCSEICGSNHSFMPINIKVTN